MVRGRQKKRGDRDRRAKKKWQREARLRRSKRPHEEDAVGLLALLGSGGAHLLRSPSMYHQRKQESDLVTDLLELVTEYGEARLVSSLVCK